MRTARRRDRGQMNKWSFLKDMIHGADVIIEVLDARDIPGTRLPIAEKWAGSKRLMVVANKIDLLPEGAGPPKLWNKGMHFSAKTAGENERWDLIHAIMARTSSRPVRAILVGYPNVGKSSLINMLARRKAARVSAVAGTTKNIQWVNITPDLMLSDYRGLFPGRETEEALVRKGALNVQGEEEKHAHAFALRALGNKVLRGWLEKRYDVSLAGAKDSEDVLSAIAMRRGWMLKGGVPNLLEACRSLVRAMMEAPEI
ncbi:MAG: GTPase [Candidatus Micrarchaeia archaeon]